MTITFEVPPITLTRLRQASWHGLQGQSKSQLPRRNNTRFPQRSYFRISQAFEGRPSPVVSPVVTSVPSPPGKSIPKVCTYPFLARVPPEKLINGFSRRLNGTAVPNRRPIAPAEGIGLSTWHHPPGLETATERGARADMRSEWLFVQWVAASGGPTLLWITGVPRI